MRVLIGLSVAAFAAALLLACTAPGEPPTSTSSPTSTASGTATGTPGSSTPGSTSAPTPTVEPTPFAVTEPGPVEAVPLGDVAYDRPVDAVALEDGLLIAEQSGVVYSLRDGNSEPALDISDRVRREGNEEGLLSIALDPAFAENGHLWVYYSRSNPRRTVLSRFQRIEATQAGAPVTFDAVAELIVLQVEQPFANHNGGAVRFGPDGMLYLGLGDGGSGGDPQSNGQSLGSLLGSIIRLDVSRTTEEALYQAPADNPFVDEQGAMPEIWAYGLRNPWRMSFDPQTGALWVGDVGQATVEEVSIPSAGDNLGWNIMEGDRCYQAAECDRVDLTLPVIAYNREGARCSITGGVVARDVEAKNIEGTYLWADYCSGELWAVPSADIDPDAPAPDQVEPTLVASDLGSVAAIVQAGREIVVLAFGRPPLALRDQ